VPELPCNLNYPPFSVAYTPVARQRPANNGEIVFSAESVLMDVKVKVMLRLTVSQSVSMSWCHVHSGTCGQIVFSV
jgi:hypothetical protein